MRVQGITFSIVDDDRKIVEFNVEFIGKDLFIRKNLDCLNDNEVDEFCSSFCSVLSIQNINLSLHGVYDYFEALNIISNRIDTEVKE